MIETSHKLKTILEQERRLHLGHAPIKSIMMLQRGGLHLNFFLL